MAEESAKKKRLVKNPETFRERAIKASEQSGKPKHRTRIKNVGAKAVSPVTKPVSKVTKAKVFKKKPFKWLGKLFRFLGLVLVPQYFRNSWKELKLVTWPNWKQSRQLTFAVIVFAVIFGAAIAAVDYGLDKAFRAILLK